MADHDELLARADAWAPAHPHELIRELAAALRAALATQPQSPTGECPICHRPFKAAGICYGEYHDVAPHQIAAAESATPTHRDKAGNEWITPPEDMWQDDDPAVAESATPTEDRPAWTQDHNGEWHEAAGGGKTTPTEADDG